MSWECAAAERFRHDRSHWACEADAERALDQYLRLGDKVYNKHKLKLFLGAGRRREGQESPRLRRGRRHSGDSSRQGWSHCRAGRRRGQRAEDG